MLKTERKIREMKTSSNAYLPPAENQSVEGKRKQKKWQEQTILANAVCEIQKQKVLN